MKKNFKLVLALVLSVMMILTSVAALAEGGDPAPATPTTPTNNLSVDGSVSVSGLEDGDKVNFIQIIEWKEGSGWAYVSGLDTAATSAGVTLPTLTTITGSVDTSTNPATVTAGTISAEHAGILAKAAAKLPSTAVHQETADSSTKIATYTGAPAGLYYAQVVPATADYLYNTIFVGADFKSDNGTNTIAANTATLNAKTNETAVAKKEQITLEKDSDGATDNIKYDHNIGDVIPFTITSKVPAYGDGYIEPSYVLTDTMESGLVLSKADGTAAAKTDINVTVGALNLIADTDYEVALVGTTGFTVTMTESGLAKVAATGSAQTITVTYKAKITSLEDFTVTEKTNEATVKFSNKPTDKDSYSLLEDKTRHYTFTIDGNLLGRSGDSYETDELIKVGLNADGTPVSETRKYHSGPQFTPLSPLQGAKFALFKESPAAADYVDLAAAQASTKLYSNSVFNGIAESDANGRIKITGLDAGTYYLREVFAPAGFIRDDRTFTITIAATYNEIEGGEYNKTVGDKTVKVKYGAYKVLNDYSVTVTDGTNTNVSTYGIENTGEVHHHVVDKATYKEITGEPSGTNWAGDNVTPISNTKGTELPSTGGIGTTIFYIAGSLLVLAAAILLITKRRMSSND